MERTGQPDVVPDDQARIQAEGFKRLMVLEGCLLAPLALMGQLWIVLQILTLILGFLGVQDKTVFRPRFILMYFMATVFGGVFLSVEVFTSISFIFTGTVPAELPDGTKVSTIAPPADLDLATPVVRLIALAVYETLAVVAMGMAARQAWNLADHLQSCEPHFGGSLTWNPNQYATMLISSFGGSQQDCENNPTGFVPFRGRGQTLGV